MPKGRGIRSSKKNRGNPDALHQYRENKRKTENVSDITSQPDGEVLSSFTPERIAKEPIISNIEATINDNIKIEGRRIVDLVSFVQRMQQLCNHLPFSCTLSDMEIMKYTDAGLSFSIWFKCKMCGRVDRVDSSDDIGSAINLNTWAVSSAIAAGIGHKQLTTVMGGMNIPCFSDKTFIKEQNVVYNGWQESAQQLMTEAAEEEKATAIERGDVDPRDGTSLIRVIADGCWSKRSYRNSYSALSGVGAIIGYHTRKVLFIGAKNKYCEICARAANSGGKAKEHVCYKNWDQSSSSMEAAIITEGFMQSEDMYGLRYTTSIGDGDSNVYCSIVAAHPYLHNPVEKIECRNHLLQNFTKKMKEVAEMKGIFGVYREFIKSNLLRMRKGIVSAVKYRSSYDKDLTLLKKDILNCPNHVFGDRSNCADYFCNKERESKYPK